MEVPPKLACWGLQLLLAHSVRHVRDAKGSVRVGPVHTSPHAQAAGYRWKGGGERLVKGLACVIMAHILKQHAGSITAGAPSPILERVCERVSGCVCRPHITARWSFVAMQDCC